MYFLATFGGEFFDPLVVKDSFFRGSPIFSQKGGKKTALVESRWCHSINSNSGSKKYGHFHAGSSAVTSPRDIPGA